MVNARSSCRLNTVHYKEYATCTLPENACSFQGVQEISQIYVGNLLIGHLGNYVHSLVVYKLRTPSILVVVDVRISGVSACL